MLPPTKGSEFIRVASRVLKEPKSITNSLEFSLLRLFGNRLYRLLEGEQLVRVGGNKENRKLPGHWIGSESYPFGLIVQFSSFLVFWLKHFCVNPIRHPCRRSGGNSKNKTHRTSPSIYLTRTCISFFAHFLNRFISPLKPPSFPPTFPYRIRQVPLLEFIRILVISRP